MKILIIGGSRFIGKYIAKSSISKGHDVTLFNRGKTSQDTDEKSIIGDVDNILDFKERFLKEDFDVVVHCISYTEKHASDLVSIFEGTQTHLIVLSSCDSYEAFQGLNRRKDLSDIPLVETSPLSSMKYYWSDSKSKGKHTDKYDKNLMTEILMSDENLNITVLRLPMVYGPEDYQYQGRHGAIIQRILDKEKNIIFTDREQCQLYTFGYVENIAAAVVHSYKREDCFNEIFNLGERESRSLRRWASLYEKYCDWSFDVHILPEELIRKDKTYRNAPPQVLVTDSSKFTRVTGFHEPISLEESIKKTFNYARGNKNVLGDRPDYKAESKLISDYYKAIDSLY